MNKKIICVRTMKSEQLRQCHISDDQSRSNMLLEIKDLLTNEVLITQIQFPEYSKLTYHHYAPRDELIIMTCEPHKIKNISFLNEPSQLKLTYKNLREANNDIKKQIIEEYSELFI